MPQSQISNSSLSGDDICQRAIALVSDDSHWMVQAQSTGSLVMRREKYLPWWKWLVLVFIVCCTLGLGLIFIPLLFIGFKEQQISISTRMINEKTNATITYSKGAKKVVETLMQSV